MTGTLSAGVEIQRLVKKGMAPSQAAIAYSPIGIQRISLFNAATDYQQFLASTVIPALLHILAMVIGATTIGRELRDKKIGIWYDFVNGGQPDLTTIKDNEIQGSQNKDRQTTAVSVLTEDNQTLIEDTTPRKASVSVLLFGLLGKYFWPMLAYSLWSVLAL